jgi:hypothetical protein
VTNFRRLTALTSTLAAAMAVACAGTALAATDVIVKVTGGGKFSAQSNSATLVVGASSSAAGPVTFTCPNATATFKIKDQAKSYPALPVSIGTAKTFAFQGCTGPFGDATLKVTPTTHQVSVNSTTVGGQTDLFVGTFTIEVMSTGCSFTVTGDAPGYSDNASHNVSLGMGPKPPVAPVGLTVSAVSGCSSLITMGEPVQLTTTLTLTPSTLDIESS